MAPVTMVIWSLIMVTVSYGLVYEPINEQICNEESICDSSENPKGYLVVCYYTDWSSYRKGKGTFMPENIFGAPCTDVIYSFAKLNDDTLDSFEPIDKELAIDKDFYGRVTSFKGPDLRVLLGIGGWTDSKPKYSTMMANENLRNAAARQLADFLVKYNFNGCNLDIEFPTAYQGEIKTEYKADRENFVLFLRAVRLAFDEKAKNFPKIGRLSLSIAVSANEKIVDSGYDVEALICICDWFGLMAYDFFGSWDRKTGFVAPFQQQPGTEGPAKKFNVISGMNIWLERGAPANMLVMGFPCYGRAFCLDNPSEMYIGAPATCKPEPGEYTAESGTLAFYEIIDRVRDKGWNVVHETCLESYAFLEKNWVSYDDTVDAAIKASYIKQKCFRGAMFWSLDNECFQEDCPAGRKYPLIWTVSDILNDYSDVEDIENVTKERTPTQ